MNTDERKIIEGLKRGDNKAYKYLYDCYYVVLCRLARAYLKDDFMAQTLVDDTVFHIYEKRESLNIEATLRGYLISAVRNRCISHLRLKREKNEINFSSVDMREGWHDSIVEQNAYPLARLFGNELEREIQAAVERLPTECRRVFEKSRYEGKTYETIATELNISVNTVKYHIKNALLRLHRDLKL
ncbi:MAG: RNA polymerase sigma-70 factor [Prevotellaceae bacterium]|jgi:RNA polymerase sigma-70 factor (ECF subfamily)|nr:RNA polymerase sigma-70 factor [Prevotellaceae bacterium]